LTALRTLIFSACKARTRYSFSSTEPANDAEDEEYTESIANSDDGLLTASYANENEVTADDDVDHDSDEAYSLYQAHKKSFYESYTPMYEAVKSSTHLIDDEKYNSVIAILQAVPSKKDTMNTRKIRKVYTLSGNAERHCLYRDGLKVTTFESVFDVILMAHRKIGHARDLKKNKDTLKDDLKYYGIPRADVKCFIETCPIVSFFVLLCFHSITVSNIFCFPL
jgi:hypothetical protein